MESCPFIGQELTKHILQVGFHFSQRFIKEEALDFVDPIIIIRQTNRTIDFVTIEFETSQAFSQLGQQVIFDSR